MSLLWIYIFLKASTGSQMLMQYYIGKQKKDNS